MRVFTSLLAGVLSLFIVISGLFYDQRQPSQEKELSALPTVNYIDITRSGTSKNTLATPKDFPQAYNYGTGLLSDYNYSMDDLRLPRPKGNETVLQAKIDNSKFQAFYLWEKGNMPSRTRFTKDMTGYFDDYNFRPYVTVLPRKKNVRMKGAVVLLAGGAFQIRGNYTDSLPTAAHLRELGFQTFIVDYRLSPYTQEEGALDVARAVRFIRLHAEDYHIEKDQIAVMGYSAGGIQAGEFLLNYDGHVTGRSMDSNYQTDALDQINAKAVAAGMIYSFYGRLSVASLNQKSLRRGNLPPTFYVYGTEDPFYDQFNKQFRLMKNMGENVSRIVLKNWPHGFGGDGGWVEDYAHWLEKIFSAMRLKNKYKADSLVKDVIHDEEFKGYGRLIFPVDETIPNDLKLSQVSQILPWYNDINTKKTVEIVNNLYTRAANKEEIFYPIYSKKEIEKDLDKRNTGLFFFRGKRNAKTAIVNAGGGFVYVGAMQDSFPHALELSKKGYNAFALIYRPGAQTACEDLSRAIVYLHDHASELQIDMKDYSLWGGSAGARMANWVGTYGTKRFGEKAEPKPVALILEYTGLTEVTGKEPPTMAFVGTSDYIADDQVMKRRINQLKDRYIDASIRIYKGLPHGFGLGQGTIAEGWINEAVAFWQKHLH